MGCGEAALENLSRRSLGVGGSAVQCLLINIRRGKLECVLDDFDPRFRVLCQNYFHHIKAEEDVWIIQHSQPGQSTAGDSFLLLSTYRLYWPSEILARSSFHFDEDQRVLVPADNVDLASAVTAKIAEKNLVAVTPEVSTR
jgi:hypothetical protein